MGMGVISEKCIGGGKGVRNRKDTDGIACNQAARMSTYAMNRFHFLNTIETCSIESAKEKLDQPVQWVLNVENGVSETSTVRSPVLNMK